MKLEIKLQERYSRGELLLRFFLGWAYIVLPHMFLLFFVGLWGAVLSFISFWVILFTGRYPQSFFEFQVGLIQWQTRVNARMYNLSDGYPAFGFSETDEYTSVEIEYPETISRGYTLLRLFFGGIYVMIPHGFVLYFRTIATSVLTFLAFFAVLFTGEYPESWHKFNVGTLRWGIRVNMYLSNMTDDYPPFSGKTDEELGL
jgi:hypothetical protein